MAAQGSGVSGPSPECPRAPCREAGRQYATKVADGPRPGRASPPVARRYRSARRWNVIVLGGPDVRVPELLAGRPGRPCHRCCPGAWSGDTREPSQTPVRMSPWGCGMPGMPPTSKPRSVAMGRRAARIQLDVRDLAQVEAAAALVVERLGRIDILVNNAGLGPENPAEDVTEADFDLTFDVNVKGLFFTSQVVGRHMIRQGGGRIVNLSSQAGLVALPGEAIYCASKAAVSHLTRCLAVEWGSTASTSTPWRPRSSGRPAPSRRSRTRVRGRRSRTHRRAPPHRGARGRGRRRGVPLRAGVVAGHRHDARRGRRLDGSVSGRQAHDGPELRLPHRLRTRPPRRGSRIRASALPRRDHGRPVARLRGPPARTASAPSTSSSRST